MSFILLGILNSQTSASVSGSYELLETTLISTNTASVTFSSLGSYSAYKHLQIRATYRGAFSSSGAGEIITRLNGDTGSNYIDNRLLGNGSTVAAAQRINGTSIGYPSMNLGTSTTNAFSAGVWDFLDFSSSNKFTTVRIFSGIKTAANSGVMLSTGIWKNSAAVTSITIDSNGLDFANGSRFSLYGIK